MIFYWLRKLAAKLAWLFGPVQPRDVAKISPRAACPVCGARANVLRCVRMAKVSGSNTGQQVAVVLCEHTCEECGARWYESPVANIRPDSVFPAIARDDIERAADKAWERGLSNVVQ